MSSDVILYCEQLKSVVGSQDTKKASTNLDAIDQHFNDRISENEIDLAVSKVFSDNGGVLGFVKLCLKQSKTFKDEVVKSFDLFVKIIELYPTKVESFATDVVIICLQYIRSMHTTAREKDKAGAVIEALVLKNCCDSIDRIYLMSELLKVAQLSKPGTVQCRIFGLIGCLAKDYPDCIEDAAEDGLKIRDMFFKALENAVINKQDTTFVSLTGAFNGLNDFLENFGPSDAHKVSFAERLYKCIKPIAKPLETSQKAVHRSALNLLANRCELFGKQIFEDYFYWHGLLVNTWLKMDSFDNRRPAIYLLHAMHREIAAQLVQHNDPDRCREILTFLQTYFKTILESSTSQPYEVRLAIVGFGLIAAPCKRLMSAEHLTELLQLMIQRTESAANAVNTHTSKEQLEHFPDYVEALSRIMEQVNQLSGVQLNVLQNIIVSVIRNFHLLSTAHHAMTINTLMRTFHNLSQLGDSILDDILEKVVLQGVIWTCSHKLPFDAKNEWSVDTDWKDQVTYVSYLPLWNGFLADVESSSYNRSAIVAKIYDQIMQALFKILDKLNLSVNKRIYTDEQGRDQGLFFSDPNYDFEPVRVKDFHIFFNLVGLIHDVLKAQSLESHKTYFLKWINRFIEEVISKSQNHPLVSGFVRLIQLILGIANRMDYFGNDFFEDNQTNYNDVFYYLSTTIRKAQQTSGELQIACLKLLFTTPTCMLQALMHDMTPAFQLAFEIGKSNASLFIAGMALSAIERYLALTSRASSEANEFLRNILPYFDSYLQGFKNDSVKSVEIARNRIQGTKRTAQKLIKVKENDLLKFQKRIILFLGTLEPEYCLYVMQNNENTNLVKWSTTQRVALILFGPSNFHPKIYMDTLIPRICEIATSTTDRQKKMTACEIIQATILYLLGSNNHEDKLWSELCKLMLELGCDGDVGVQQMFEPLVMQTMHYLSKDQQLNLKGTSILLTCLMDAISHPSNLPVRDLASRSLREFLSWAFRQAKPEQIGASPFNVDALLRQLKMFNSDALHQRRFGAALAFNNIYRVLREEDSVLSKHWLDLLHDFCVNFKLSEQQLEQNTNCQIDLKQVSISLDHILRVLRERKNIFNAPEPNRVKTEVFEESVLLDAVVWLLGQCNSTKHAYRKKVMEMFVALAPCVAGYNSTGTFIRDQQNEESVINSTGTFIRDQQNEESVIKLCENGIEVEHFEPGEFAAIYTWLKRFHTTLDCYIWYIENNFMLTWRPILERGRIFVVLEHYINNIMHTNLCDSERDLDYALILEKERINAEKSAILLLIFQFLNKIMPINCIPDTIWQSLKLVWVIERSVFNPQTLECDTKNPEFLSKLSRSMETFISSTNRYAPEQFSANLTEKLVRTTTDYYENFANSIEATLSRSYISTVDTNNLKGVDLVCGLIRSKAITSLPESLKTNIDVMASKVLYQIFEGIKERHGNDLIARTPSPDTLKFTSHLLQVCFNKNGIYVNLIDLLLNTTELRLYNSMKSIKHGKHFLSSYKSIIYKYFLKNVEIVTERLIAKIVPPNVSYLLHMLIELTEIAYSVGSKNLPQMQSLTNILLGKWSEILSVADRHIGITTSLIELMGQVAMICPYELTEISKKAKNLDNWLLNIITSDDYNIETKIQAIFLLPCLIGQATYEHQDVQNALEKFQTKYFPLYTSELRPGTVSRTTFENAFQIILDTMCASKSFVILQFIINCTVQDSDHIMDHKIVQSIRKFMVSLKAEHQLNGLNKVFEMFTSISFDSTIRTALMKRFLSHMILSSDKDTVIKFYEQHIRKIEQLLDTPYGLELSEYRLQQAFTSRIGAFELLEILSMILTRDEICDTTNPILIAKFGERINKDNQFLSWMSTRAANTKTETFQTNNAQYMEWFRKYQCAAFKALCSIMTNTVIELRFFEKHLFLEKNWWNLINTIDNNLYTNQTLEVDKRPQIKERMVLIRQLKQKSDDTAPSRRYIESQNVFESSLSQDVTKIDLSNSYVRTTEEVEHQNRIANYQPKSLMLEKSSVNDHEVMATICGVVQHMFEEGITPTNDDGTVRRSKPAWIESICNTIANQSNGIHMNIRIFLVTMVDNCSKYFRNYADIMTRTIAKFLIDWTNLNRSIDALTVFLLVDILEWDSAYRITKDSSAEEHQLASDLMENLMTYAHSTQREMFRRNLELIRNLMERWRDVVKVPHQLLYAKICDSNPESKLNICGLHLNGIVLANQLVPWINESKNDFLRAIRACLNNIHSDVYQPAAQVLGMMLHEIIVTQNNGNIDEEIERFIDDLVNHLKSWYKSNEKKFMYVLFYIDKYYVINQFITTISSLIATSTSDTKKFYLQMFLARVNDADPRDIEVILLDLLSKAQEHQHQLVALHIFNKALPKLNVHQIKNILGRVVSFHDAKQTEKRDVVYEIMKYIHENHSEDEELSGKAKEILLKGLNDVDKDLQNAVFKYWNELPELPPALNDRVLFMFRSLYSRDFLKYSVQLLIDLTSNNLKQPINQTLATDDEEKYTEYDINVNWKSQDSSLRVPLFTESQQKQIVNGEIDPTQSYLRATQHTMRFDPTLDPSTLHQTSTSFSLQSQSSLLIGGPVQTLDRRSQQVQPKETPTRTKFSYLRERILRNKDAASRERALSAVRRRDYKQREENQQQQRKEGQVTLYRRYRFGDFPDFFINSLAFLLPLQMLVKLDVILARNTFVAILNAVYQHLENHHQKREFMKGLAETIESIIRQPNNCDPLLFSALTEIILNNSAELKIDPRIVTSIANANDIMINAILLLENDLITTNGTDDGTWAELANMYYTLSEYDVAASIFSNKIKTDKLLSKAIESEANGNYQSALKLYTELVDKSIDDDLWNRHASDFSYQLLFNCYEAMGRWEDLENNVIEQLRDENDSQQIDFEQLWTDEWNAKYLLPHYIRSEVRTMIHAEAHAATRSFIANIEQWLRNSTRADSIKKHFGEQLMVLHVANKDYLEAKVFSNQYFESFLDEWSAMSVLSEKMRNNKLMNTRRVAEIHKYADLLTSSIDDIALGELTDRWQRTQMKKADSTQMWEALISYRIFITQHALEKFQPQDAPIVGRLVESMFDMQFKLNEIAVQQQNIELSKTLLRRLDGFRQTYGRNTLKSVVQYELAKVKLEQIEWNSQNKLDPKAAFGDLVQIWANLRSLRDGRRNILDENPDIRFKVLEQFNEITDQASEIVLKCDVIDDAMKQKVAELTGAWDDSQSMPQLIGKFARRLCVETITLAEKCEESRLQTYSNLSMKEHDIGESYYRLAIFCLKQLKSGPWDGRLEVSKLLVKSVLRGMKHDSKNARLQFPRLLQLPNIDSPELTGIFDAEVNEVPSWIFLGWITQIIARFHFKDTCFLDNLLIRLATKYPSTVVYPFQLAFREYRKRKPNAPIRPVVQQIRNAIQNPMIKNFIKNMRYVSLPHIVLAQHLHNAIEDIAKNGGQYQDELRKCYDNVFGNERGKSTDQVEMYKGEFVQLMEMRSDREIQKAAEELLHKLRKEKYRGTETLNAFSPWLAKYHWYGGENAIELPGQHIGNVPPNPSNTLKIVKFEEKVSIFHSLRRPIKISCVCSDGKTYSFLVKYGEDLRLDDQIQQIEKLMSDQMAADKSCSQQKLSIRTYRVIPLSVDYGIISWIDNTKTIGSLISNSVGDTKWRQKEAFIIEKFKQFTSKAVQYHQKLKEKPNVAAVLHYSPKNIADNLKALQSEIPENSLRNAIYELSASPECYFALRSNFSKSLAAMSIAHWVLGIGDRHLENFVIDKRNAQLIGIDFNMAFGAGTRKLNIPELVPFRMTNQFVNVMKPLGTSGFLIKCMAHVLRTFRLESESLMAALECLICDRNATENDFLNRGVATDEETYDTSSDVAALKPEEHLSVVKQKLNGINPVIPIEEDLKHGFYAIDADIINAYTKILNGRPERFRHKLEKQGLSVEDQVQCLIDIASDPAILGVSFQGARPWV